MVEEFGGPDVYKSRLRPKARPLVAAPQSSWLPIGFMSGSSAPPAAAAGAETVRHASPVHLRNADRDVRRLSGGEPAPGAVLGTLRVRIDSAWHLLPKDRNGKSDPYVLLRLTSSTEYYQTKAKMRTLEPTWEEETSFTISTERQILHIAVFDHDLTSEARLRRRRLLLHHPYHHRHRSHLHNRSHLHQDDLIGELMIPVASVIAFPSHYANVDWPHQLTPSAEDQKKARDKASASVEEQKKDPPILSGGALFLSLAFAPDASADDELDSSSSDLAGLEQIAIDQTLRAPPSLRPVPMQKRRSTLDAPPHMVVVGGLAGASPRKRTKEEQTGAGPPKRKHDIGGARLRPPACPPARLPIA